MEYTLVSAVEQALFLRKQPECLLSGPEARALIETLLCAIEAHPCYMKALLKGEQVFVLRQQDRAAPGAINMWAVTAKQHGCTAAKVEEAFRISKRWDHLPDAKTKWPD